jgi:hypothetical protein
MTISMHMSKQFCLILSLDGFVMASSVSTRCRKKDTRHFFHSGEDGVTIHKEGTITITASELPVLTGGKSNAAKLWTISSPDKQEIKKEVNNVYSLPVKLANTDSRVGSSQR